MSASKGNSSSISAEPVEAVAVISCRLGIERRYSSCSMRISFSMSCGVAPGQDVTTLMVRTCRSGIIWMGMVNAATRPSTPTTPAMTVINVP